MPIYLLDKTERTNVSKIATICENCGYEFQDEELEALAVRRSGAIECPQCGKIVHLFEEVK